MKNPVKWLLALLLVLIGVYFYRFDPVGVDTAKFYLQLTAVSILIVILGALIFLAIVLFSPRIWGKLKRVTQKTSGEATVGGTGAQKAKAVPTGSLVNGSFSGSKFAILCAWVIFLVLIWIFNPKLWEHIATNNWGWFVFWNVLGLSLLWALPSQVGVIAYVLFAGVLLGENPEKYSSQTKVSSFPIVKTVIVHPGTWETVRVPRNHTFFYECDGWGLVKILGNKINPKECGPRPSRKDDWFGDNLQTVGGNLYISFTTTTDKPVKATVKIWPNSSL